MDRYERIAVLVSSPELRHGVLSSVPRIKSSARDPKVAGLIPILDQFGIKDNIFSVYCDSTATQTGRYKGTVKLLQDELGQFVLWLVCRSHNIELHVKYAHDYIFGGPKSPSDKKFKKLQENWNSLTINKNRYKLFEWEKINGTFLEKKVHEVKQYCQMDYSTQTFPKDDYKELNELLIIYLAGNASLDLKRPGSTHYARFMSKAIYAIKLKLLDR